MSGFIFTTRPNNYAQTTSQLFLDNKNAGQMPCPVSDSDVFAVPNPHPPQFSLYSGTVGRAAASVILKHQVDLTTLVNVANLPFKMGHVIFPTPDLVVSYPGRELAEAVEALITLYLLYSRVTYVKCKMIHQYLSGPRMGKLRPGKHITENK